MVTLLRWARRPFLNRFFRSALFPLILIVLLVYLASSQLMGGSKNEKKVTLSEFRRRQGGQVKRRLQPEQAPDQLPAEGRGKGSVHYPSDQSVR